MSHLGNRVARAYQPVAQSGAGGFGAGLLRQQVAAIGSDRRGMQHFRTSSLAASGNLVNRLRRRAGASESSAVAQFQGGSNATYGGALDNALRRSKIRSRIAAQGDSAIEQQGLRDRIALAQASRAREGDLLTASARARNIREGVNIGVSDANAAIRASNFGLYGTLAGAIGGVLANEEGRAGLSKILGGIFGRPVPQTLGGDNFDPNATRGMA